MLALGIAIGIVVIPLATYAFLSIVTKRGGDD
jgi:hypothetical protein